MTSIRIIALGSCLLQVLVASDPCVTPSDNDVTPVQCNVLLQAGQAVRKTVSLHEDGEAHQIESAGMEQVADAAGIDVMPPSGPNSGGPSSGPNSGGSIDKIAALNEFIAMTLFVIIGCGSAMGSCKEPGWVGLVALAFGFAITALASATGGQINCAVTFGLVILNKLTVAQAVANLFAQLLGSVIGAFVLHAIYGDAPSEEGKTKDKTGGLGSNGVSEGFTSTQALIGEVVMTFLLMYVVIQTALIPVPQVNATIAIGFAVFLAHAVLIPIDGCSINPTRSFGPAVVAVATGRKATAFADMWVFWIGPLVGAGLAAGLHRMTVA